MDDQLSELVKKREIVFDTLANDQNPAQTAAMLLDGVAGVLRVTAQSSHLITIEYSLQWVTLRILQQALTEVGFHLDNSLLSRIKNALYHYTEETQLANLGYEGHESKSTKEIFINSYLQQKHGCRDERPLYYHHYN